MDTPTVRSTATGQIILVIGTRCLTVTPDEALAIAREALEWDRRRREKAVRPPEGL